MLAAVAFVMSLYFAVWRDKVVKINRLEATKEKNLLLSTSLYETLAIRNNIH